MAIKTQNLFLTFANQNDLMATNFTMTIYMIFVTKYNNFAEYFLLTLAVHFLIFKTVLRLF